MTHDQRSQPRTSLAARRHWWNAKGDDYWARHALAELERKLRELGEIVSARQAGIEGALAASKRRREREQLERDASAAESGATLIEQGLDPVGRCRSALDERNAPLAALAMKDAVEALRSAEFVVHHSADWLAGKHSSDAVRYGGRSMGGTNRGNRYNDRDLLLLKSARESRKAGRSLDQAVSDARLSGWAWPKPLPAGDARMRKIMAEAYRDTGATPVPR